jgi:hypothetical protein
MRHYFAYVRRGAVRLGAATSDDALSPVAFRNADGGTVVVVRAGRGGRLRVTGLPAGRYVAAWTTRERAGEAAAVSVTSGGSLAAEIPGVGFLTLAPR